MSNKFIDMLREATWKIKSVYGHDIEFECNQEIIKKVKIKWYDFGSRDLIMEISHVVKILECEFFDISVKRKKIKKDGTWIFKYEWTILLHGMDFDDGDELQLILDKYNVFAGSVFQEDVDCYSQHSRNLYMIDEGQGMLHFFEELMRYRNFT